MAPVVLAEAEAFKACGADVGFTHMLFLMMQFQLLLAFKHLIT